MSAVGTAFGQDSLRTRRTLVAEGRTYDYYSIDAAAESGLGDLARLPFSLKVLLENLLRWEDGRTVTVDDIKAMAAWLKDRQSSREIAFRPARVLMQDFTGVPAIVDLAAMRDAMAAQGGDPRRINPLSPVDLVIDHSVMVDRFGSSDAMRFNVEREFERNMERYAFLRWGQSAFDNFRVVPPGTGICHQVNLEYLAQVVWYTQERALNPVSYPDTLVGTDSHTTMVNGLAVLGWGVGGIEAEAAMLGQPISMLIPKVVGFRLFGSMKEGTTATDLVLTVTQMLRKKGVVGKFVEFFGDGLDSLSLPDRATIANMAPEYGATCSIFPVDAETIRYLRFTARAPERIALVEAYAKSQGMWRETGAPEPLYSDIVELDLGSVEPSLAGPKRPQDRIALSQAAESFRQAVAAEDPGGTRRSVKVADGGYELEDGAVVIAAITSCTNTSNPSVLIAAGLLARKAVEKGLKTKPWVKTSLAPGSQVVAEYLMAADLQPALDSLGFNIAGFGCTTCIGNSGPLDPEISAAIDKANLVVASVLSGNRNFEGRIHPQTRTNYLASPPLVVAYALAGNMNVDLYKDPLGKGSDGRPVYLKDLWPSAEEVRETIRTVLSPRMYKERYADVFTGPEQWRAIALKESLTYPWDESSTYVQNPPYFTAGAAEPKPAQDIVGARPLAILGDSVTTDHISPAGSIKPDSPAGKYLIERGVKPADFNSYGARRGNHEVMMRGTFANIRIRNEMVPGIEGGFTRLQPQGVTMPIYDAAMAYQEKDTPLVIIAGKEYGTGSSRDWAAKGTRLLGVKAVVVESFERIHRSNLVGMGVLPLQFKEGTDRKTLRLDGAETYDVLGIAAGLEPGKELTLRIRYGDGRSLDVPVVCRIDTADELEYFRAGGILQHVLRRLRAA